MTNREQGGSETGAAMLLALATAALITALAASLMVSVSIETTIVGSARAAQEVFYAADAALERTLHDLAAAPDWSPALDSPPTLLASFDDGLSVARAPDGRQLSIDAVSRERQAVSATIYARGCSAPTARRGACSGTPRCPRCFPPACSPRQVTSWSGSETTAWTAMETRRAT